MRGLADAESGWSRSGFWLAAAMVFAGQVAWILLLGERGHAPPLQRGQAGNLRFLDIPLTDEKWDTEVFAVDPTIFPGSGNGGFASRAWHQLSSSEYSVPVSKPAPSYLDYNGLKAGPVTETKSTQLLQIPFQMALQPEAASGSPSVFSVARSNSFFRIGDALANRQIAPLQVLPSWTADFLVSNTVVQFGINRAGEVVDESLVNSSGLEAADNSALQSVRGFRFRPLPRSADSESWHTATFYWKTDPSATDLPK